MYFMFGETMHPCCYMNIQTIEESQEDGITWLIARKKTLKGQWYFVVSKATLKGTNIAIAKHRACREFDLLVPLSVKNTKHIGIFSVSATKKQGEVKKGERDAKTKMEREREEGGRERNT